MAFSLFILSCGGEMKFADYSAYRWPSPPEKTRIKLENVIFSDLDFRKPTLSEKIFGREASFNFLKPHGVAADKRGNIYVSDSGRNTVDIINVEAGTLGTLASPSGYALPLGLAYNDEMDWLAIADADRKTVVVMDAEKRELVLIVGQKGGLDRPVAAAIDAVRQRIYVADVGVHKIRVFDFSGNFLFAIGEKGTGPGKLYFPSGLKVDKDGNIVVVNSMNFRFDIFDPEGKHIKSIGQHGDRPGMFARPKDVAIDSGGRIYVTDAALNNFQVFDRKGNVYIFIGYGGDAPGSFNNLFAIFIDKKDRIYVTDQINRRVQIFQHIAYPGEPDITNATAPESEEAEAPLEEKPAGGAGKPSKQGK